MSVCVDGEVAVLVLSRGKVNALDEPTIGELEDRFRELETDEAVRAVIFSGEGKFFSFGFDVPEFLAFSKEEFTAYVTAFSGLYTYMFLYPKPLVAALNGHAVAGGCMLALACDGRVMAAGNAKIALNEITFGSTIAIGISDSFIRLSQCSFPIIAAAPDLDVITISITFSPRSGLNRSSNSGGTLLCCR